MIEFHKLNPTLALISGWLFYIVDMFESLNILFYTAVFNNNSNIVYVSMCK